jgi:hypothetical protein
MAERRPRDFGVVPPFPEMAVAVHALKRKVSADTR